MEKGETREVFIRTLIFLAKLHNLVKAKFFADKLETKINNFSASFLDFSINKKEEPVAQYYISKERSLAAVDSLVDVFKELKYLNLVSDPPLLLHIESNLLTIKLEILKDKIKSSLDQNRESTSKNFHTAIKRNNQTPSSIIVKEDHLKMTENKKKILEYIKSFPNTRTKEIIHEFNVLSNRTVKRNLTDLLRAGLVKKRIDNKAVYYYASE